MRFIETLRALPVSRQIMLVGAVLGVVLAMFFMVSGAMQERMALLYSGLDPVHAGEIIEELEQDGVPYEIKGEAIFIPESRRDSVRFNLASQGLPRQSVQGYELLDDINGFSITSEMYNAAYWRAKEGELTRTILAIPGIESARVHIGASLRSGFSRSQPAQTASVTLTSSNPLSASQAEAIQFLVALAVSGLNPEEVAVIDPSAGILAGPGIDKMEQPGVAAESQSVSLEQKIMRLLDARVGPGNARVSVSVDVSRDRRRTSEVVFDPRSRVVRNRTITDSSETSRGSSAGLTVASNLPQGEAAAPGSAPSTSDTSSSSETVSYEMNEIRTETESMPGEVERISIAVLLNEQALGIDLQAAGAATQIQRVVENFEQLIASGAGLDLSRGDTLTVELMPFQALPEADLIAAPSMVEQLMERYLWSGVQIILLGLVVIVLGLGVVRPLLAPKAREAEIGPDQDPLLPGAANAEQTDPFDYLRSYASERQDETAALLQDWLNKDEKVALNE
ncbi:MAG: flagellar M-ring protein FliF [Hyphomonadaceae bacterium]|nr:flagellar M-ring protein FliF [Hyphomonadaceae bacterium]